MAPSPGTRGPAKGASGGDRSARSLRAFAEAAERDRSNPEELARLLERAAAGEAAAVERVFNENLAMVLRMAREHAQPLEAPLTEDELVQEGSTALLAAIHEYAVEAFAAEDFPDFAEEQVGLALDAAVDGQAAAERAKRQLVEDAEAYERAEVSIRRDKGRQPTLPELAEKLEWPQEKTRLLGEMVAEARRRHDQEMLLYVEPDELSELDDE